MMIDSKTKWSVWGMLFGMAVVLGAGVAFLAFILTRDPQILAFLYDKITVPQSLLLQISSGCLIWLLCA